MATPINDRRRARELLRVVGGRQPAPYVQVPQWVVLAAGPQAVKLYALLAGVAFTLNTNEVEATRQDLAKLMDYNRPQSVDPYIAELEGLGAIDVVPCATADGRDGASIYVIHHDPPDAYTGMRSVGEWLRSRNSSDQRGRKKTAGRAAVRSSAQQSEQGKRSVSAGRAAVRSSAQQSEQGKDGVSAGRPSVRSSAQRADQGKDGVSAGRAAVRSSAQRETGVSAGQSDASVTPIRTKNKTEEHPPTPHATTTGATAQAQGGGDQRQEENHGHDFGPLVAEILRIRPDWFSRDVKKALNDPDVSSRDPEMVRAAFLVVAKMPDTKHPARLTQSGPWWTRATVSFAESARRPLPDWCGDCDKEDRSRENDKGQIYPCPRCNPRSPAYVPEGADQ